MTRSLSARFLISVVCLGVACVNSSRLHAATDKPSASPSDAATEEVIEFGSQVRPILSDKCFHCHGPDSENQDSDFRADTRESLFANLDGYFAVVPGDLDASELHARIHSDDPDEQMPPPDSNRSLTDEQKRILDRWIKQGAPYEKHWSFQRPTKVDLPIERLQAASGQDGWDAATAGRWSDNPIDVFVGAKLIENEMAPSPRANPQTLLRRASLTLTALLPNNTLQESSERAGDDLVALDAAYHASVNVLLDSMAYAERQTLKWLDAARYADTDGYQNDYERTNWPWRDWVIKAFRDNKPFNEFTIEQLAGDMLPNATREQILASAFNRNHRQNGEGGALKEEFFVENVIDRVETTSTVWLGLTFGCARCHDHKYDPLSQREFFQLFAYFNNIGEKGIGKGLDANPTVKTVSPLAEVPDALATAAEKADAVYQNADRETGKRYAAWLKKQDAGDKSKRAEGVEDKNVVEALTRKPKDRLSKHKRILRDYYNMTEDAWRTAKANLDATEQALLEHGALPVVVMVMRERPGKPEPAYLLDRGQYDAPLKDDVLPRAVPKSLWGDEGMKQPANRLELAQWLVSERNPLTARVIVNRIWQDHFGVGLVKTSDDFGVQGEAPSHPELLDWLAVEFIESGWNIKAMHRLILTSETYQQCSKTNADLIANDPENRLLGRGPRYRADGFTIRDLALQASGLLVDQPGGPPVKPYQPTGLWEVVAANKGTRYQPDAGAGLYRKSLYSYWKRAVNPPRQTIFDAGGREVCNVASRRTNTPLQALVLMNDPTFIEAARKLAERSLQQAEGETNQLKHLYRQATALPADERTLAVLADNLAYFREHYAANAEDAKKLLSIGQSSVDDDILVIELAATTAVAHLVLNTDQFITIE